MRLLTEAEYVVGMHDILRLLKRNDPADTVEVQALADRLVAYEEHHFPLDTPSHLNADAL